VVLVVVDMLGEPSSFPGSWDVVQGAWVQMSRWGADVEMGCRCRDGVQRQSK
jgi:hypothetical protein